MENFTFLNTTKVIFGRDTQNEVGKITKEYTKANAILVHYGQNSIKESGLLDKIIESISKEGIQVIQLGGVVPNPRLSLVKQGIQLCKENEVGFVLAIGGGSVIDSAKAIAFGSVYEGDVWDFFNGKALIEETLPVGVVLTIAAAGSENSGGAVITNENGNYKRCAGSELCRPKFAIMNPEITYTLSKWQTACGIVDIMAHVLERYFTNTEGVDFTDRLCEATLKTVIHNAKKVFENPMDYHARSQVMWAGTLAHNDIFGVGREQDWSSHLIEHELSGICDIAHGAGLAIVMPAWMKFVYKKDVKRFAHFANKVFGIPYQDEDTAALLGIQALESFFEWMQVPVKLCINDPEKNIKIMAKKATEDGPIGKFVSLTETDVVEILHLALKEK